MKSEIRQDDLPAVVRALAGQKNIAVRFTGNACISVQVNEKGERVMQLPPIPLATTPEQVTAVVGVADHESAHALYTDFTVSTGKGMRAVILNILEDARIERKLGREYPGTASNLAKSAEHFIQSTEGRSKLNGILESKNPAKILPFWLDADLRAAIEQGPGIQDATDTLAATLDDLGLESLRRKILDVVGDPGDFKDTSEVARAADAVMDLIKDQNQQAAKQQQQPRRSRKKQQSQQQSEGGESEGGESEGSTTINTRTNSDEISKLIAQAVQGILSSSEGLVYEDGSKSWHEGVTADDEGLAACREQSKPIVASLVARMQSAFEAKTRTGWISADEGLINPRRLALAGAGLDPTPFRRKTRQLIKADTCVSVWIDLSSSMFNEHRAGPALTALVALAEACQRLNTPMEAHGWYQRVSYRAINGNYSFQPLGFFYPVIKPWNMPWGRGDFSSVLRAEEGHASSNGEEANLTPTDKAIMIAMESVGRRPEVKKIILFLTDGVPLMAYRDGVITPSDEHRGFTNAVEAARLASTRFTFVPIGIQDDIPWYPRGVKVDDLADLPSILLNAIKVSDRF